MVWNIVDHNLNIKQELHWRPQWNLPLMFVTICPLLLQSLVKVAFGLFCNSLTTTDQFKHFLFLFYSDMTQIWAKTWSFWVFEPSLSDSPPQKLWIYQFSYLQAFNGSNYRHKNMLLWVSLGANQCRGTPRIA